MGRAHASPYVVATKGFLPALPLNKNDVHRLTPTVRLGFVQAFPLFLPFSNELIRHQPEYPDRPATLCKRVKKQSAPLVDALRAMASRGWQDRSDHQWGHSGWVPCQPTLVASRTLQASCSGNSCQTCFHLYATGSSTNRTPKNPGVLTEPLGIDRRRLGRGRQPNRDALPRDPASELEQGGVRELQEAPGQTLGIASQQPGVSERLFQNTVRVRHRRPSSSQPRQGCRFRIPAQGPELEGHPQTAISEIVATKQYVHYALWHRRARLPARLLQ